MPRILTGIVGALFVLQVFTGLLLMTAYSPSTTTAWASVWYVQTKMPSGWFIRGVHHVASDGLLVALVLLVLQIAATGACRWEYRGWWWATLLLAGLTLTGSLSGELLPWDQAGYWGTTVRLNILARTPWIGEGLKTALVGGSELGNLTLTRFYALHAVMLPLLMAAVLYRLRKAARPVQEKGQATTARPLARALVSAVGVAVVAGAAWFAHDVIGLNWLDAPADATTGDYPARPEWHTLFLYQWLKYFQGPTSEVLGAIVAPGVIVAGLFALPLLSRFVRPAIAGKTCRALASVLLTGAGMLTFLALYADRDPSDAMVDAANERRARGETLADDEAEVLRAREFNVQRRWAGFVARRAMELADHHGVPPEGPLALLANDPLVRGPMLFAANCASCHRCDGHDGLGRVPPEPATSSDLQGYGTRKWIRGLLQNPMATKYFGRMKKPDGEPAHTRMARAMAQLREEAETDEARATLDSDFDAVAVFLEHEASSPGLLGKVADSDSGAAEGSIIAAVQGVDRGQVIAGGRFFARVCNECHSYQGERTGTTRAPEMFGYASPDWIATMIADPSHPARYGSGGREPAQMPPFGEKLGEPERWLLAEWLHQSDRPAAPLSPATLSDHSDP